MSKKRQRYANRLAHWSDKIGVETTEPANWVALCREDSRKKRHHFEYGFIRFYLGGPVRGSVGVRFHEGLFWPHVNGRIRLQRRGRLERRRIAMDRLRHLERGGAGASKRRAQATLYGHRMSEVYQRCRS